MDMHDIIHRHAEAARRVAVPAETNITIEPFPQHPGFTASITGHLADPETDPIGTGATREAAALDLARSMCGGDVAHPCLLLAVAAAMRENLRLAGYDPKWDAQALVAYDRAIRFVEGIA